MRNKLYQNINFWILSAAIGVFAVIFAKTVDLAFQIFLHLSVVLHYWLFLYIPCGFVITTYIVKKYFPESAGSGIPQILSVDKINDIAKLKTIFYPRIIFSKFLAIVLGTLCGASIGREGPTVQIGAAILALSNKKISIMQYRVLLKIGAAAGLAAAFNTPLGGVVFALEKLFKDSQLKLSLIKITAIAVSGLVSILIVGQYSYFGMTNRNILFYTPLKIIPLAILIGVASGIAAVIFSKLIHYTTISNTNRYYKWRVAKPLLNAFCCGLIIALLGILSNGLSFGNGYYESKLALSGTNPLPSLYVVYKMLGSLFSTCSGIPGGYFATSLAIGEGIGSLVYNYIHIAPYEQYYLLGMVAFLAAITQAPITAITMVLQVTYSQVFLLPLMVAALIATYIANKYSYNIYHCQVNRLLKNL